MVYPEENRKGRTGKKKKRCSECLFFRRSPVGLDLEVSIKYMTYNRKTDRNKQTHPSDSPYTRKALYD